MAITVARLLPSSVEYRLAVELAGGAGARRLTAAHVDEARVGISSGRRVLNEAEARAFANLERWVTTGRVPRGAVFTAAEALLGTLKVIDPAADLARLDETQRQVLTAIGELAAARSSAAHGALVALARQMEIAEVDLPRVLAYVRDEAPLTINFRPEIPVDGEGGGTTLVDLFLRDDRYRSLFDRGVRRGRDRDYQHLRDRTEERLFAGLYHRSPVNPSERPIYAALNSAHYLVGGADPYGSCYFVLAPGVRQRATLTPYDSTPCKSEEVGTPAACEHVLARIGGYDLKDLAEVALGTRSGTTGQSRYTYLEAQIHGPVEFAKDVVGIVADARYRDGPIGTKLRRLARRFGLQLAWQDGAQVSVEISWAVATSGRRRAGVGQPTGR